MEFSRDIGKRATHVQIGGVYANALTGESYAIILFILSGMAGGVLGELGVDIWNVIKKSIKTILQLNSARRNVVEVMLEFKEYDIVLHVESRSPAQIPKIFKDADVALVQLKREFITRKSLPRGVKTVEIRLNFRDGKITHVLYSYRRIRFIMKKTI